MSEKPPSIDHRDPAKLERIIRYMQQLEENAYVSSLATGPQSADQEKSDASDDLGRPD